LAIEISTEIESAIGRIQIGKPLLLCRCRKYVLIKEIIQVASVVAAVRNMDHWIIM